MEKLKKLSAKDLINTGIFTAIYFVVMFVFTAVISFAPITYVLLPAFIAILCAPIYMLFITFCSLLGLISDLITKAGGYTSKKMSLIGYYVFSIWPLGSFFPIWLMRDAYFDGVVASMGEAYAEGLKAMTPFWIIPVMIAYTIAAGVVGGLVAGKMNKKHFEKAGIA